MRTRLCLLTLALLLLSACHWFPNPPKPDCRILGCPAGEQCVADTTSTEVKYECQPEPTPPPPDPPPDPTPDPTPDPPPDPTPTPDPPPDPTPPPGPTCSVYPSSEAVLYLVTRALDMPGRFDSTLRVKGDPAFCMAIHGVAVNDCHLEGMPNKAACEVMLMGGCPVWQYLKPGQPVPQVCHDDHDAWASCDHFGSPSAQDDPQTKDVFEGLPAVCGIQRDEFGPYAGFFVIAHGEGQARACAPNQTVLCGQWKPFNH